MNVSTRLELQTMLENIRTTQTLPDSSPLSYRAAWVPLILTPLIGVVVALGVQQPYSYVLFLGLLALFVASLQSIIKYKFYKLLRPILEALLYVPEEPAKQEEQIPKKATKAGKVRPRRGGKK